MKRKPSRIRALPISFRPRLEPLESRTTPTAFTITGMGDTIAVDGLITLREAITAANTNAAAGDAPAGSAGLDTISFGAALKNQTITLTAALPTISQALNINGLGANNLTINANSTGRVFNVASGVTASISGLKLTGGLVSAASGGGILNSGTLTLSDVTLANNKQTGISGGGGIASIGPNAQLTMTDCIVSSNTGNFGGGLDLENSHADLTRCVFVSNFASASGGGIRIDSLSVANILFCTVAFNTANGNAINGGGISNNGSIAVISCSVFGNSCSIEGGGIFSGQFSTASVIIQDTTIANNSAQDVGGLFIRNGLGNVNDCTITGNFNAGSGFGNEAGGLTFTGSSLILNNTIVAMNSIGAPGPPIDIRAAVGTGVNNFIGIGDSNLTGITNGTNGNQIGTSAAPLDPKLGPLQNNGGPTLSRLPVAGSPVINAGGQTQFNIAFDQRGLPRKVGGAIDIGAVEFSAGPLSVIAVGADLGSAPEVKIYDLTTNRLRYDFNAYEPAFQGGVRVAVGDISGDGIPDYVVGPGGVRVTLVNVNGALFPQFDFSKGRAPEIKVFSGLDGTKIFDFLAYAPSFTAGVFVAVGDVNHDGQADIITAPEATGQSGHTNVRVFFNNHLVNTGAALTPDREFNAYDPGFGGGVRLAVADLNNDGFAEVVTAPGIWSGPDIRVFSGQELANVALPVKIGEFLAYDFRYFGGVFVSIGDVNGDGKPDIVTGTNGNGGPEVKAFSGANVLSSPTPAIVDDFFAYDPAFNGGARVAVIDVNGDGKADIITGSGPGATALVRVFDGATGLQLQTGPLDNFLPFDVLLSAGVFVGGQ